MLGTDSAIPTALRLPEVYRLDVTKASDAEVLTLVGRLMHAYMDSLRFGTTRTARESKAPYDVFLAKNDLPPTPDAGESNAAYADRLLKLVEVKRSQLAWVGDDDGEFELHHQPFRFGPTELKGLETFLRRGDARTRSGAGNCVACHTPPRFTDHSLHNTGVAQAEYDAIFGAGAFAALPIPALDARNADHDRWLPATPGHPNASGRYKAAAAKTRRGYADLGAWNVVGNPDMPKPQPALLRILCDRPPATGKPCTPDTVLPLAVATFKTPSVRDLGQSNPYFHTGAMNTVGDVLRFYLRTTELARSGKLRNAAPELSGVHLVAGDLPALEAFLRSLNEDYQ
jgi:cytochrome c peroxidase